ncbi:HYPOTHETICAL PROTEIN MCJ_000790 [Mesomycoplasma conjunctivae]|uniref:Uncharacterized protein n=1 Tax=Mesomycoplasma conjunctivae (strain ATCC 25834 / NCTC 10147 / HRC/581) TaxID=572263 RepID=C5J5N1_MESCH|nr:HYPOTHETICAL PROTEIN MCJ_000790 [Mesomycoplasma conjunctivae]
MLFLAKISKFFSAMDETINIPIATIVDASQKRENLEKIVPAT